MNGNKNGNPIPFSVKRYLLLGVLLPILKQKSGSSMVGFYMKWIFYSVLYFEILIFLYIERGRLYLLSSIKSKCKLLDRKTPTYSVVPVNTVGEKRL